MVIELAEGVGTSIVGNSIYDKLKGRTVQLRINREQIAADRERMGATIRDAETGT